MNFDKNAFPKNSNKFDNSNCTGNCVIDEEVGLMILMHNSSFRADIEISPRHSNDFC